jgi:hypothetical protein
MLQGRSANAEKWRPRTIITRANFCKGKAKERGASDTAQRYKSKKEQIMEYLILVAVVSVMALYAVIIVGCLKHPEW